MTKDSFFSLGKYLTLNYHLLYSILIKLHSEHVLATFLQLAALKKTTGTYITSKQNHEDYLLV